MFALINPSRVYLRWLLDLTPAETGMSSPGTGGKELVA